MEPFLLPFPGIGCNGAVYGFYKLFSKTRFTG